MTDKDVSLQLKEYFGKAKKVYLVTAENPDVDTLCSVACLHKELMLRDKQVTVFAPDMNEDHKRILFGIENVFTYLPEQRTTIKVNVENRGVKKVNYELKGNTMSFFLTPKEGQIYNEDVKVFTPRIHADLVVTLGVGKPSTLTQWPNTWASEFQKEGAIVNIDTSAHNSLYGSLDVVQPTVKTMVQLTTGVLDKLGWNMSAETASMLMQGLVSATDHFSKNVDADVFSLASLLMQKDGKFPKKKILMKESENAEKSLQDNHGNPIG